MSNNISTVNHRVKTRLKRDIQFRYKSYLDKFTCSTTLMCSVLRKYPVSKLSRRLHNLNIYTF
ncbi:hypothetical protein BABINDRAFT_88285 [Babjeviella inositovora NRRL Y-12698]|uniref:Uncharacterized protein n=1 Tax=Babjeviella inositovora NRRL Y-12698 TaxID=984486 RepID=A0A1E3QMG9_9ASCO|nr:uncharacterized protein BABINDRAFT_88285 [Babjeviella inositovora NRRL Y-12698]ODQ78187.1 hypothetical protein BABINDRAFT_88285 [Babjeviella inositovora NRRL Y-12698]